MTGTTTQHQNVQGSSTEMHSGNSNNPLLQTLASGLDVKLKLKIHKIQIPKPYHKANQAKIYQAPKFSIGTEDIHPIFLYN
jgi:hypothetical protein